jgi:hypothetical protein
MELHSVKLNKMDSLFFILKSKMIIDIVHKIMKKRLFYLKKYVKFTQ